MSFFLNLIENNVPHTMFLFDDEWSDLNMRALQSSFFPSTDPLHISLFSAFIILSSLIACIFSPVIFIIVLPVEKFEIINHFELQFLAIFTLIKSKLKIFLVKNLNIHEIKTFFFWKAYWKINNSEKPSFKFHYHTLSINQRFHYWIK